MIQSSIAYWIATSLQPKPKRGVLPNSCVFNDIPPHERPLPASFSSIPRIPIWSIVMAGTEQEIGSQ